MKSVNAFVERLFSDSPVTVNGHDNQIRRAFMPSDRYGVDFATDFAAEGWEQFDTDQDAHYFGVWVNRKRLQTLTYAEGDWTLVTCSDREHYNAEISDAIAFYGEGFIAKAIEPDAGYTREDGTREARITIYRQERDKFLIS